MSYIFCFLIIESLLFIGAGDGAGVGAGAGEKNTRSRSRPKTDRLHNTACDHDLVMASCGHTL